MARLTLSKSTLSRERKQLQTFQRFLPSLDLKRKQLLAERSKARHDLKSTQETLQSLQSQVMNDLPMLCNQHVDLQELVKVTKLDLEWENLLGVELPILTDTHLAVKPYGLLSKPHWVDVLVKQLSEALRLEVTRQVQQRRLALLERAVQVITQRVNLFDKVLIPRTRNNIRRIQVYLADAERAAVVRAKLAKNKNVNTYAT